MSQIAAQPPDLESILTGTNAAYVGSLYRR